MHPAAAHRVGRTAGLRGAGFAAAPSQGADFEATFDAHFLGRALVAPGAVSEDAPAMDDGGPGEAVSVKGEEPAGAEAPAAEALRARAFALPQGRRRLAPRRVVLRIDVSGSMRAATEANLRAAHALARATGRVDTFMLGTRLTRVTRALGPREPAPAPARAAVLVVVSDGLERGEPATRVAALARLSRLAWRLVRLTPLPGAEPRALAAARPILDALQPAPTPAALLDRLLALGRVR